MRLASLFLLRVESDMQGEHDKPVWLRTLEVMLLSLIALYCLVTLLAAALIHAL